MHAVHAEAEVKRTRTHTHTHAKDPDAHAEGGAMAPPCGHHRELQQGDL